MKLGVLDSRENAAKYQNSFKIELLTAVLALHCNNQRWGAGAYVLAP